MKRRFSLRRASLNVGGLLVAFLVCYGLLFLASEKLPDPASSGGSTTFGRKLRATTKPGSA